MLPNAIIAGVPRAGTTSLFTWLADHPDVEGSIEKETFYFVDPETHSYRPDANFRLHGLAGYEQCFPRTTSASVVLESTPQYIYQKLALAKLPDLPTRPKFVFVLRDPADQMFSTYSYFRSNWNHLDRDVSFPEYVELARGRDPRLDRNELLRDAFANCEYQKRLDEWIARAGADRVLVCMFEDVKRDRTAFVKRVARFLGVDPAFYDGYDFPLENYSYKVKNYALHELNIRVRSMLPLSPRSRIFRALRDVYRKFNTEKPAPETVSGRDREVKEALRAEFSASYAALAARYSLASATAERSEAA